jgi:hypothetical protein
MVKGGQVPWPILGIAWQGEIVPIADSAVMFSANCNFRRSASARHCCSCKTSAKVVLRTIIPFEAACMTHETLVEKHFCVGFTYNLSQACVTSNACGLKLTSFKFRFNNHACSKTSECGKQLDMVEGGSEACSYIRQPAREASWLLLSSQFRCTTSCLPSVEFKLGIIIIDGSFAEHHHCSQF